MLLEGFWSTIKRLFVRETCVIFAASSQLHTSPRSQVEAMDALTKDFAAVIPFREIGLPPLGSLASNVLLFSLTVIAILLVPVS